MTIEELQEQLAQANANVALLSNELSNQADQFARWRGGVSQIAAVAHNADLWNVDRVGLIQQEIERICGV